MAYGTANVDTIQSSTAGTPPQFNDGNGTQIGTLCRAWVNYKGTATRAINASFNVSSVTYNSTGSYTLNFTNAMPDANYSSTCGGYGGNPCTINSQTASACNVISFYSGSYYDAALVTVAIFR